MRKFVLLLVFSSSILSADPWGKDADLVHHREKKKNEFCNTLFLGSFAESAIKFHQDIISPADGPRSHFVPSSSQYTLDAMRKYGFFQGFILGCDRLMRENEDPWVYPTRIQNGCKIKYDPVR